MSTVSPLKRYALIDHIVQSVRERHIVATIPAEWHATEVVDRFLFGMPDISNLDRSEITKLIVWTYQSLKESGEIIAPTKELI